MTMTEQTWRQPAAEATSDWNGRERAQQANVSDAERALSVASGALLAIVGISRRSIPGVLVAGLGGGLIYRGISGHCPAYESLGINNTHREAQPEEYFERGIHVAQSYLINKPPAELYQFWRNFENLPRIMTHLESVRVLDNTRSHWVAKAPAIAGGKVEWDAEIINDVPNEVIAWRSLGGADVDNAGSVRFRPMSHGRGTMVSVSIDYIPPAGRLGKWVARLFGEEPQQQIQEDLRNFKRIMETGEIPTTQGQPKGTCRGLGTVPQGW